MDEDLEQKIERIVSEGLLKNRRFKRAVFKALMPAIKKMEPVDQARLMDLLSGEPELADSVYYHKLTEELAEAEVILALAKMTDEDRDAVLTGEKEFKQ